jgi:7-carboxy-7-deazaguanine synthase
MTYQVNEIFRSVQGEGLLAGTPATFIRLQGCTVGCPWCDTKYTWNKGGTKLGVDEILEIAYPLQPLAVITGGEPTLYNLDELIKGLWDVGQKRYGYTFGVQLETSGQQDLKGELRPNWITWSPKPNLNYNAPEALIKQVSEVKWVIDDEIELDTILTLAEWFNTHTRHKVPFVLMPEGTPPTQEHVDKALEWVANRKHFRYGDRIQWRIGVK